MSGGHVVHERSEPHLIDVLDRVLDKGIIISYDIDVSVAGLRTIEITGRVIIASIETYRRMEDASVVEALRSPALSGATDEFLRRIDHAH